MAGSLGAAVSGILPALLNCCAAPHWRAISCRGAKQGAIVAGHRTRDFGASFPK